MIIARLGADLSGRLALIEPDGAAQILPAQTRFEDIVAGRLPVPDLIVPADSITLAAPVLPGARIICLGLNFHSHAAEAGIAVPDMPSLFVRFPESLSGPGESIRLPTVSSAFDFEGELAVVIGTGGRHIPQGRALDHVFGYTCFADNSLRDWQAHSRQVTPGKNFDRSGAIGPWIVSADAIGDLSQLTIETRVNGERRQFGKVSEFIFPIEHIVSYISGFTALRPGDVIAMGTPPGCAFGEAAPRWLRADDEVTITIPGIGTLANRVIADTSTEEKASHD